MPYKGLNAIIDIMHALRAANTGPSVSRTELLRVIGLKACMGEQCRAKYIKWMLEFGLLDTIDGVTYTVNYDRIYELGLE
jgi:hypothetical protein